MTQQYQRFISRNHGYITPELQDIIVKTKVLVAGCGIGSQVVEAATRLGFQNFILVDGDTVDFHNLNRQSFLYDQVGKYKVEALKENILRINPRAHVETHSEIVTQQNVKELVGKADLIFDTIDFLDLSGIVAIHDEAHKQKKYLVSSFSVGFGAAVISLPPNKSDHACIRDIFNLPSHGDIGSASYVENFIALFSKLAKQLDPQVVQVMGHVFQQLADGKTCPAPQVSPGAYMVAAACTTAAIKMLEGDPALTLGPEMVVISLSKLLQSPGIPLAEAA